MKPFALEQTDELLTRYRTSQHLARTRKFLSLTKRKKQSILRDHSLQGVDNKKNIDYRVSIDVILDVVGVLEVVALATGGTPTLEEKVAAQLRVFLEADEIKTYYEVTYPLALPVLFLARLDGKLPKSYLSAVASQAETTEVRALSLLIGFVELDCRRSENKNLEFFLDLMDDYKFDGMSLDSVLSTLDDPTLFTTVMLGRSGDYSDKRDALRGLTEFVRYCRDFRSLLLQSEDRAVLASAMWVHNSYWFGAAAEHSIKRAARKIEMFWANVPASTTDSAERVSETIVKSSREASVKLDELFTFLTNWRVRAKPIVNVSKPLLNQWQIQQVQSHLSAT